MELITLRHPDHGRALCEPQDVDRLKGLGFKTEEEVAAEAQARAASKASKAAASKASKAAASTNE